MLKNHNKKIILASILLLSLIVLTPSNSAFAQTTTSTTAQLQELVNKLLAQVAALQEQMAKVKTQQQEVTQTISEIITNLKEGDKNENVKALQALLAADTTIYPEGLITGFYGPLTTKAVRKFQEKHGLEKVGFIGPKTKLKLNELLKDYPLAFEKTEKIEKKIEKAIEKINKKNNDDDDEDDDDNDDDDDDNNNDWDDDKRGRLCAIIPPGHLIAPGWLKKHKDDDDKPIIPLCQILPYGIIKKLPTATTTPPIATSTPPADITAPIISAITVSASSTSANISWTTNETATSKAYYSTVSPLDLTSTSTLSISTSTLSISHLLNLSGLTASSTYYFAVESKDVANNIATSTEQSFITSQ